MTEKIQEIRKATDRMRDGLKTSFSVAVVMGMLLVINCAAMGVAIYSTNRLTRLESSFTDPQTGELVTPRDVKAMFVDPETGQVVLPADVIKEQRKLTEEVVSSRAEIRQLKEQIDTLTEKEG